MLDLNAGVCGLKGGNRVNEGLVAGVALGGDGPQGQRHVVVGVGRRGAHGEQRHDHAECEDKRQRFFHGVFLL